MSAYDVDTNRMADPDVVRVAHAAVALPHIVSIGFVASTMWRWFAVEPFGLPTVSTMNCVGLWLLLSLITYKYGTQARPTTYAKLWKVIAELLGVPWFVLLLAWGAHAMMAP